MRASFNGIRAPHGAHMLIQCKQVIQSADCFVDAQGVIYLTDNNAGLYILLFEGA